MSKSNYESILKAWENVTEGSNLCSRWLYDMLKISPDNTFNSSSFSQICYKKYFPFLALSNCSVVSISLIIYLVRVNIFTIMHHSENMYSSSFCT
jgi:hypothetical protein